MSWSDFSPFVFLFATPDSNPTTKLQPNANQVAASVRYEMSDSLFNRHRLLLIIHYEGASDTLRISLNFAHTKLSWRVNKWKPYMNWVRTEKFKKPKEINASLKNKYELVPEIRYSQPLTVVSECNSFSSTILPNSHDFFKRPNQIVVSFLFTVWHGPYAHSQNHVW